MQAKDWKVYSQFRSHFPEFDCLKNIEIEEKINCIEFCNHNNSSAQCLLTCNGKKMSMVQLLTNLC